MQFPDGTDMPQQDRQQSALGHQPDRPQASDEAVRLEVLDRAECLRLLRTVPVGRVAIISGGLPAIHPVNYVTHGDSVVFRTGTTGKLATALRNTVVAFEADDYDMRRRIGWSVNIVGHAHVVTDPAELAAVQQLPLTSWVPGNPENFVCVAAELVTGRRISHAAHQLDMS